MSGHVVSKNLYYAIFATLLVLTAVTVWVAFIDLGPINTVVAMGIAVTKATLVILFFMHVRWADRLTSIVVTASFVWLIILFAFTLGDYFSRSWQVVLR